jgi:hypothetical protein
MPGWYVFLKWSSYLAQASLELFIFLPHPPKYLDYRNTGVTGVYYHAWLIPLFQWGPDVMTTSHIDFTLILISPVS